MTAAIIPAPPASRPPRHFVPETLDPTDWAQVQPLFDKLDAMPLQSEDDALAFLDAASELSCVLGEAGSRTHIAKACDTESESIDQAFKHWVEKIGPQMAPAMFKLQQRFVQSDGAQALGGPRMQLLLRDWKTDVELFREQNVPLQTEVTKLSAEYDQLVGKMLVEYDGKTQTLQQLGKYLEVTDRSVREATWTLSTKQRLQHHDAIDGIYHKQIELRQTMAKNAGFENYRDYAWRAKQRFDYSPDDCLAFHDAIEKTVLPLVKKLDEARRDALAIDTLRPWDLGVDPLGREPLRPFPEDQPEVMLEDARQVFHAMDPEVGQTFAKLEMQRNLDLVSRPGKRAGGFQASLTEIKEPFIFMNAAGLQRDVDTMLHEAGHALHFIWSSQTEPLSFLQHAPIEFCEVASMGMELMAMPQYDAFHKGDTAAGDRARRAQLEGIVRFFPWMAIIDAFQHWIYTHPGHTGDERQEAWLATMNRFGTGVVDWSGLEDARAWQWQKQLHLLHHPFYYVEYGIAQLGAIQLWARYREDSAQAMIRYREALALGGTRPLPQLFEAAGLKLDFTAQAIAPLIKQVQEELDRLPS